MGKAFLVERTAWAKVGRTHEVPSCVQGIVKYLEWLEHRGEEASGEEPTGGSGRGDRTTTYDCAGCYLTEYPAKGVGG